MANLSKDDLDYLWTHLGELVRAANTGDDLRVQRVVARLIAESDDPIGMSEACDDAMARLARYGRSRARHEDHTISVNVGDVVSVLAPSEWADTVGIVVFIDPRSTRFPISVEFRDDDRVAVRRFAAHQLRRPG